MILRRLANLSPSLVTLHEDGGTMIDFQAVEKNFRDEIGKVNSVEALQQVKARYLGKRGELSGLLQQLGSLPSEERPTFGARANELKRLIEEECHRRSESIRRELIEKKIRSEFLDCTLPGREIRSAALHPLTQVLEEVEEIFGFMGFEIFEGPEIESDYYNFEALNIPQHHPAREMQDTFYISPQPPLKLRGGEEGGILLRTHTSPVQVHVMEREKPPIRMIAPGVVYRRDDDASHSPMFHQVEGLVVGERIRFSDLKGVLTRFLELFFGKREIRFRPSYFPFTEPSAEVDVKWKEGKFLEVLGCGMVHPNVFRAVGYDAKKVTGFAFGMGIERLAMLKHGIPDIRLFYENDLRFLRQF